MPQALKMTMMGTTSPYHVPGEPVDAMLRRVPAPTTPPGVECLPAVLGKSYTAAMRSALPDVDPGIVPVGYLMLCQLIGMKHVTSGGILLPGTVRDESKYRVQTALVRAMGPVAFHKRDTMEPWPEGPWCTVGSFVRIPIYGGDRFKVANGDDDVVFVMIKDLDVIGVVTGDPLTVKGDY